MSLTKRYRLYYHWLLPKILGGYTYLQYIHEFVVFISCIVWSSLQYCKAVQWSICVFKSVQKLQPVLVCPCRLSQCRHPQPNKLFQRVTISSQDDYPVVVIRIHIQQIEMALEPDQPLHPARPWCWGCPASSSTWRRSRWRPSCWDSISSHFES